MSREPDPSVQERLQRLLQFLDYDPNNVNLLLQTLELAIESGNASTADTLVAHVDSHGINVPEVHAQLAHLLLLMGSFAAAAKRGDKAIQAGIDHPVVIYNTAVAHFYSEAFIEADTLLGRLTPLDDCSRDALCLHARTLHHLEQPLDAATLAERALAENPGDIELMGLLALLRYESDDNTAALDLAYEVLAEDPNQLDALIACASANFELGRIEPARKAWHHTTEVHPDCGRAWSGLGLLEFNEMELEQAKIHLTLAVKYMPNHIGTWHLLAWVYILENNSLEARAALNASLELDRNFAETHGGLAVVDVMDGHEDSARLSMRRAMKLNTQGFAVYFAELLLLKRAGKDAEADALVNRVLDSVGPNNTLSGRKLVEQWLQAHQKDAKTATLGQH